MLKQQDSTKTCFIYYFTKLFVFVKLIARHLNMTQGRCGKIKQPIIISQTEELINSNPKGQVNEMYLKCADLDYIQKYL